MTIVQLIELNQTPIFGQLQLEEALLHADHRNFIIINRGSPCAIVMGLSGDTNKLLNTPRVQSDEIPVIQRFSGGGTVVVDENTLFISFIFSKKDLPISPFPESIMRWSEQLYHNAWGLNGFSLQGNDYTIHNRKCGGNAQYITKDRWLHHTSFLWDYSEKHMQYLLLPEKQPMYRQNRSHTDFLCRLKHYVTKREDLTKSLKRELVKRFDICPFDTGEVEKILARDHRKTTRILEKAGAC